MKLIKLITIGLLIGASWLVADNYSRQTKLIHTSAVCWTNLGTAALTPVSIVQHFNTSLNATIKVSRVDLTVSTNRQFLFYVLATNNATDVTINKSFLDGLWFPQSNMIAIEEFTPHTNTNTVWIDWAKSDTP